MNSPIRKKNKYFPNLPEYQFDRDWLIEKYYKYDMTLVEISELVGCSETTIIRHMERFRLPRRKSKECDHRPEERFWSMVDIGEPAECWEWTALVSTSGYGVFSVNADRVMAHRFSWELYHGPIPDGIVVCHHCDNPPCVNPTHLFLGTQKDNMEDAARKGRIPVGEERWNSKLTEREVKEIIERIQAGEPRRSVAKDYEVGNGAISNIVYGRTWTHITGGSLS